MANTDFVDRLANFILALTLLTLSPLAAVLTWFNYAATILISNRSLRFHLRHRKGFRAETVLISGASSVHAMKIARAFRNCGHDVIGLEFQCTPLGSLASLSRAYSKVYYIQPPSAVRDATAYGHDLIQIIRSRNATIWIECQARLSNEFVAEARNIVKQRTAIKSPFAVDEVHTQHFKTPTAYYDLLRQRGLPAPELHHVQSRNEIHNVLNTSRGKKHYLLGAADGKMDVNRNALLPRRTLSQTYRDVSMIRIAKEAPLVLQEQIDSDLKFDTLAIVVCGKLKAFKAQVQHSRQSLRTSSPVDRALKQYVQLVATELGPEFSGHLSQHFCVLENITSSGIVLQILPVEAKPMVSDLILHFMGKLGAIELVLAYISKDLDRPEENASVSPEPVPAVSEVDRLVVQQGEHGVYGFPDAIKELLLLPLINVLLFRETVASLFKNAWVFINQLVWWTDSIYAFDDPLPAFWTYFLKTPVVLLLALVGRHGKWDCAYWAY